MRRLLHLSDIHFGRARRELVGPLIETVNRLAPDLVVISGDFTQRARHAQFARARDFIDALGPPVLGVPGNHDVQLYNLFNRFFRPWNRYRRYIDADLSPVWRDGAMTVVGVNTANPYVWQSGRITARMTRRICETFDAGRGSRIRAVVLHHPLQQLPEDTKKPTRGAAEAMRALCACGVDLVLSGHLHTWRVAKFARRTEGREAIQIFAGTGLSNRLRGEENDFNLLTFPDADTIRIERHVAGAGTTAFTPAARRAFSRIEGEWVEKPAGG